MVPELNINLDGSGSVVPGVVSVDVRDQPAEDGAVLPRTQDSNSVVSGPTLGIA